MKENDIDDKLLTGGGIIPAEEIKKLNDMGVGKLFGPGTSTGDAVEYVKNWAENKS
jgi:methylmalonyl-CoA mutase C-terminal domain/subunit